MEDEREKREIQYSEDVKGKWGPWIEEEFCRKDVEKFLDAIGLSEEEKSQYIRKGLVPPTFFTIFRRGRPEHGVRNFRTFLHAEQEYEIFRFPSYGEKIRYRTRISDIYEKTSKKTGNKMVFVVFETEFFSSASDELLCVGRATLVFL